MKTKTNSRTSANLKIFMVLPVIAVVLISFSSCGRNKTSEATLTAIAPPPPPPPPVPAVDSVYVSVDELPVFKGGNEALMTYLKNNTVYPAEAKKNSIKGRVVVKMVIGKDCSVSHVEILNGVNPLLDAEAVRVVSTLPKFEKPGIKGGEAVAVQYAIPITFNLQ
jgi:TonB family protein